MWSDVLQVNTSIAGLLCCDSNTMADVLLRPQMRSTSSRPVVSCAKLATLMQLTEEEPVRVLCILHMDLSLEHWESFKLYSTLASF